jgi:hypothetical protein
MQRYNRERKAPLIGNTIIKDLNDDWKYRSTNYLAPISPTLGGIRGLGGDLGGIRAAGDFPH